MQSMLRPQSVKPHRDPLLLPLLPPLQLPTPSPATLCLSIRSAGVAGCVDVSMPVGAAGATAGCWVCGARVCTPPDA